LTDEVGVSDELGRNDGNSQPSNSIKLTFNNSASISATILLSARGYRMRWAAWSTSLFFCFVTSSIPFIQAEEPAAGKQVEQKFDYPKKPRHNMGYLLYLPTNYSSSSEKHPLILFLHGSGERGSKLSLVKRHGPPKIVEERSDMPFIVVSPQLSLENQFFDPSALSALLDSIEEKYRVDKDQISVTGLSMGGGGTWQLAAQQPNRFAAIAPICGWTDPRDGVKLKQLSVWAIHGDIDGGVPFSETEQMIDALRAAGGDVKFTVHHGGGHDAWTSTYAMPEFYEWLLRHRRGNSNGNTK
jgi:predicted peptidase